MKSLKTLISISFLGLILLTVISCKGDKGTKNKNGKVPVDYQVYEPSSRLNSEPLKGAQAS